MFATSSQWNVKRFVLAMSEPVSNFALRKDLARQHWALPSLSTEKKRNTVQFDPSDTQPGSSYTRKEN